MAMTTDKIRNIGLIGQRGSGKTILAEAMAYGAGVTNRLGSTTEGTTISDYTEEEKARQTSLNLSLLKCPWKNGKINVVDMPGHMDFTGDVVSGLAVADTAIVAINASGGVEVGTIQYFDKVQKMKKPAVFIINGLDKENTNFNTNLTAIQEAFGTGVIPVQIPIGKTKSFNGIIDLIKMKAITFDDKGKMTLGDIPGDLQGDADAAREKLMEAVAESSDELLEKFFDAGELTADELVKGLKNGIASGKVYPVLVSSATLNIGATSLMEFVIDYLPNPGEVAPLKAKKVDSEDEIEVVCDSANDPMVLIFKTISEQHVGDLCLAKVFSGKIQSGLELINIQRGSERIGQVYTLTGKDRKEVDGAEAGDIVALVKLKDTHTGNSLCPKSNQIVLPEPDFPEPVMDVSISPKSKGDEEKMGMGLNKLHETDPTFKVVLDPALHQTLLFGQGDTQIDLLVEKLKNRFGVEVELGRPLIPYRETIKGKAEIQGKYKKQSGGRGQFGDCWLRLEPKPRGEGFEFKDEIKGGVIPGKFVPSVEKGVIDAMREGLLTGSPVVDTRVTVYFGSYHSVDSSDNAFKMAGSMAFRGGYPNCKPIVLEPIYNVAIFVPEDYTGDVMGDISSRRGKIIGMEPLGKMQLVRASVPQAELYKYSVDLRSFTQGQGVYTREFSNYEEVPPDVSKKLQEDYKASRNQD
ncbi:MAG: elongation factor G [candidate division Zixibacteria bacterium]|nr:elongation factor G [candidate division Zixibacteria bacterium]